MNVKHTWFKRESIGTVFYLPNGVIINFVNQRAAISAVINPWHASVAAGVFCCVALCRKNISNQVTVLSFFLKHTKRIYNFIVYPSKKWFYCDRHCAALFYYFTALKRDYSVSPCRKRRIISKNILNTSFFDSKVQCNALYYRQTISVNVPRHK